MKRKLPKVQRGPQAFPTRINEAVNNLISTCGFDRSESSTEIFYYMLYGVLKSLRGTIEKSHKEGLCIDMAAAISWELSERIREEIAPNN